MLTTNAGKMYTLYCDAVMKLYFINSCFLPMGLEGYYLSIWFDTIVFSNNITVFYVTL